MKRHLACLGAFPAAWGSAFLVGQAAFEGTVAAHQASLHWVDLAFEVEVACFDAASWPYDDEESETEQTSAASVVV